jgi:hypothetical protein
MSIARDDAQLDLRLAELRVVGGDDEVAHHGQLATAAEREPAHGRDHRFADLPDGFPVARDVVALVDVGKAVARHRADVGAGGEGLLAAGDDHAANGVVGVEGLERGAELVHQLVVERIELLGAI